VRHDEMSTRVRLNTWVRTHHRAVAIGVASAVVLLGIAAVLGWAILNGQRPGEADAMPTVQPAPSSQASESSGPSTTPHELPSASSTADGATAGWTATAQMNEVRAGHTATLLPDGTVLVTGGLGIPVGPGAKLAERYDPRSGTWTATANMNEGRGAFPTATLLPDGTVLVAGGSSGPAQLASAELYDPSSGSWTAAGNMIEARTNHTATLLPDGKVLVAGGGGSGTLMGPAPLASAELYDPGSGTWTAIAHMNEVRSGHTATLLPDGRVLVAGGSSGPASLASAELYDPSSETWTATGNMLEVRSGHTATLLPDGTVLVAGGANFSTSSGSYDALTSAELYDPGSGTWTATASMVTPRYVPTATLLPDGRVLVAGGISSIRRGYDPLASAELYHPSPGSWTATGSMAAGRQYQTDTLLPNGKVLVAGGESNSGALASTELYEPGSGT